MNNSQVASILFCFFIFAPFVAWILEDNIVDIWKTIGQGLFYGYLYLSIRDYLKKSKNEKEKVAVKDDSHSG